MNEEKTVEFIQKVAESYKGQQLYAGNSGGKTMNEWFS